METKSGDRQLTQDQGLQPLFTGAQLNRLDAEVRAKVQDAMNALGLRMKAIELAAKFPPTTDGPMKLAKDIYKFLSDTEV